MALRDEEVRLPGITPREHTVQRNVLTGRARYPFKYMLLGDFFVLTSQRDATASRDALKSFNRRSAGRRFAVRLRHEGIWICRRIA